MKRMNRKWDTAGSSDPRFFAPEVRMTVVRQANSLKLRGPLWVLLEALYRKGLSDLEAVALDWSLQDGNALWDREHNTQPTKGPQGSK